MSLTKYYINPNTKILPDTLKNLMVNITINISHLINPNVFLTNEDIYISIVNKIIYVVTNYFKVYKFANYGITNINVEIYNKDIKTVLFVYFQITQYYYYINHSNWNNFYYNILKNYEL